MRPTTREDYLDRIRRVLRFVQEHLDEDLSPGILSDVAHLSLYHFHRIFSGLVGESLAEHVRRIRLERAAGALRRTDDRVIDVALAAGYDAHEPFTRAFRARFGVSPSAWRSQPEPLTFPAALCGVHFGDDAAVSQFVPMKEDSKMIKVNIERHAAEHLLALPHEGDYQQIGSRFEQLVTTAGGLGLLGPDSKWIVAELFAHHRLERRFVGTGEPGVRLVAKLDEELRVCVGHARAERHSERRQQSTNEGRKRQARDFSKA